MSKSDAFHRRISNHLLYIVSREQCVQKCSTGKSTFLNKLFSWELFSLEQDKSLLERSLTRE